MPGNTNIGSLYRVSNYDADKNLDEIISFIFKNESKKNGLKQEFTVCISGDGLLYFDDIFYGVKELMKSLNGRPNTRFDNRLQLMFNQSAKASPSVKSFQSKVNSLKFDAKINVGELIYLEEKFVDLQWIDLIKIRRCGIYADPDMVIFYITPQSSTPKAQ